MPWELLFLCVRVFVYMCPFSRPLPRWQKESPLTCFSFSLFQVRVLKLNSPDSRALCGILSQWWVIAAFLLFGLLTCFFFFFNLVIMIASFNICAEIYFPWLKCSLWCSVSVVSYRCTFMVQTANFYFSLSGHRNNGIVHYTLIPVLTSNICVVCRDLTCEGLSEEITLSTRKMLLFCSCVEECLRSSHGDWMINDIFFFIF